MVVATTMAPGSVCRASSDGHNCMIRIGRHANASRAEGIWRLHRLCLKHGTSIAAAGMSCALVATFVTPAFTQTATPKPSRAAPAQATAKPLPANIDRNGVLILAKSALLALDHANKTGNYTVLRDLGSANFQANTAARLAEIFASQRQQRLDLSGLVVLEPQLTLLPQIEPDGKLHLAGFFPSSPMQVNFDLSFEPVNREWRLFGISVQLSAGGPTAPETAAPAGPQFSREPPNAPTAAILPVKPKASQ